MHFVHSSGIAMGGVLARRAPAGHLFLTILHPCLFLPLFTKQSTPKSAGVMQPLLIFFPSIGDPREGSGYVANPPIFGPLRRQG